MRTSSGCLTERQGNYDGRRQMSGFFRVRGALLTRGQYYPGNYEGHSIKLVQIAIYGGKVLFSVRLIAAGVIY